MADKHSEVEAKFKATLLDVPTFLRFIVDQTFGSQGGMVLERYKFVAGDDVYYERGTDVVRHRFDGTRHVSVLTVKKRKSADSVQDRHEIDLPLREDVSPGDAAAFLKMTGWSQLFAITKMSYIAHVKVTDKLGKKHTACLALYDVMDLSVHEAEAGWDRYLEVEIEKDSDCTHEEALDYLKRWVTLLRSPRKAPDGYVLGLGLDEPMNQSLYEIYRPAPKLLPEATIAKLAEQDKTLAQIMKETVQQNEQVSRCVP